MHVQLRDPHCAPTWIGRQDSSAHYYQSWIPARCTGGRVLQSLSVAAGEAGRPVPIPIDLIEQLDQLDSRAGLAVYGLGDPCIFRVGALTATVVGLIAGINAAGGNAWVAVDDDFFSLPPAEQLWPLVYGGAIPPGDAERAGGHLRAWREGAIQVLADALRAARGALVTTPALARALRPYARKIVVLPNVIDPNEFTRLAPVGDSTIRIGYGGSYLHLRDLGMALPGLLACARAPGVELHFWGVHPCFGEQRRERNEEQGIYRYAGVTYHYHGTIAQFQAYHRSLSILDVAVAPLWDTAFNRAKSACKWLEHSLHGTPMVVSDLDPYAGVAHGVTGFKARTPEELAHYVRLLVDDAALRRRIGEAARAEVLRAHTPAAVIDRWRAFVAGAADRGR